MHTMDSWIQSSYYVGVDFVNISSWDVFFYLILKVLYHGERSESPTSYSSSINAEGI